MGINMFSHVYSANKQTSKSIKNQTKGLVLQGLVMEKVIIKVKAYALTVAQMFWKVWSLAIIASCLSKKRYIKSLEDLFQLAYGNQVTPLQEARARGGWDIWQIPSH